VLLGALLGAKETHRSLGLLFVDGHEDAYAPHESPTGELADMELGLALGRSLKNVPGGIASLPPLIDSLDVVLLGVRDADVIRKDGSHSLRGLVEVHSASEIVRENLIAVTKQAIAKIFERNERLLAPCGSGRLVEHGAICSGLSPARRVELGTVA
jgi:arginase family enzyme